MAPSVGVGQGVGPYSFNDKVKVLNGFINVFGGNVLLMVTLTPYDCYD